MALYYELPVYRDVYKLILMIFECTGDTTNLNPLLPGSLDPLKPV
jgi:hypothetical protein